MKLIIPILYLAISIVALPIRRRIECKDIDEDHDYLNHHHKRQDSDISKSKESALSDLSGSGWYRLAVEPGKDGKDDNRKR